MFVMYTIICFSPLVTSVQIKFTIGYISMATVTMHLVVNFVFIGNSTFRKAKLLILLELAKKKHKKQRQELSKKLMDRHQERRKYLIKRRVIV